MGAKSPRAATFAAAALLVAGAALADSAAVDDPRGDVTLFGFAGVAAATPSVDILRVEAVNEGAGYTLKIRLDDLSDSPVAKARFHAEGIFRAETGGRVFVALTVAPDGDVSAVAYLRDQGWRSVPVHATVDAAADLVTFAVEDATLSGTPSAPGARAMLYNCALDGCSRGVPDWTLPLVSAEDEAGSMITPHFVGVGLA